MHLIKNKGKVRAKKVINDKGKPSGYHIEHGDGRVDAVARPDTIRMKLRMERD